MKTKLQFRVRDAKAELNRRSQACDVLADTGFRVAKKIRKTRLKSKVRAEVFTSARLLLSLVDFGDHGFGLLFQRNKSMIGFNSENPASQINGMDADSDFGRLGLRMGQELFANFEPMVHQFYGTETAQHNMQRPEGGMVKFVGPMLRLVRGFGGVGNLITDVWADSEADVIGQDKILAGHDL
jgi:hypothetical protein